MLNRHSFLAATALSLVLALPVVAEDAPTRDTVVATVNGTDITLGHMIMTRAALPEQYQGLPDDVLFTGILDQLVQQTLLASAANGETARVRIALENERRSLLAGEVIDGLLNTASGEEAIKAAYDAKYARADPTKEWNASHILVKTEEEAKELVAALKGGADFATLAKEKSTGPSGPNGGELGWFGPGMMVEQFETAVSTMENGAISAPTETRFGWHVIKLNDSRIKAIPPLEEVRAEIEAEVQRSTVDARINELTAAADIKKPGAETIDPAVLKKFNLLEE